MTTLTPTWGHKYWLAWSIVTFLTFIAPEVYALCTNWRNTLSSWIWTALNVQRGQTINQWTAAHFLVGGMLVLIFAWLIGHLVFHLWAS